MNNTINVQVYGNQGMFPCTYKTIVLKPNIVNDKNILNQGMINTPNTKYVIKYDFLLSDAIVEKTVNVVSTNVSQCGNAAYAEALAAYNLAHDAWIDADNAYTNNPNDTTLAAKNAAYAALESAQLTLNGTPQYYYFAGSAINIKKGQHITIPEICVLLNDTRSGIVSFDVAPNDMTVYIGSATIGSYYYKIQNCIVMPVNCLIEFDGGSISDGVLICDETILIFDQEEEVILKNVELFGDYEYSAGGSGVVNKKDNVNGMATLTLKKNKSFASQLTQTNTIYRIMYDFDLDGESVTIPENCVLQFDGGSIDNGTVIGQRTYIEAGIETIFGSDVNLAGSWSNEVFYPEWFGAKVDDDTFDCSPIIVKIAKLSKTSQWGRGTYYFSPVVINNCSHWKILGFGKINDDATCFSMLPSYYGTSNYLLKIGGKQGMSPCSDSTERRQYEVQFFEISGININDTANNVIVNAVNDDYRYASLVLDCCVEGVVDVRFRTYAPALYIRDTWEIVFSDLWIYFGTRNANNFKVPKIIIGAGYGNVNACAFNGVYTEKINGSIFYAEKESKGMGRIIINNLSLERASFEGDFIDGYLIQDDFIPLVSTIMDEGNYDMVPLLDFRNANFINGLIIDNISLDSINWYVNYYDESDVRTYILDFLIAARGNHHIAINSIDVESCSAFQALYIDNQSYHDGQILISNYLNRVAGNTKELLNTVYVIATNYTMDNIVTLPKTVAVNLENKILDVTTNPHYPILQYNKYYQGDELSQVLLFTLSEATGTSRITRKLAGAGFEEGKWGFGKKVIKCNNGSQSLAYFKIPGSCILEFEVYSETQIVYNNSIGIWPTSTEQPVKPYAIENKGNNRYVISYKISANNACCGIVYIRNWNDNTAKIYIIGLMCRSYVKDYGNYPAELDNGYFVGQKYFVTSYGMVGFWSGSRWVGADGFTLYYHSGNKINRPRGIPATYGILVPEDVGFPYFDTTIGKMIYAKEINPTTGAVTWVDALGNNPDTTVYPKVIGTPTAGNLVKFNSTDSHDIEDAGVTPTV